MAAGSAKDFEEWTRAWLEFVARAPVRLCAIENDRHLRAMVNFMDKLVDQIGDRENHYLMGLLDILATLVHDYEQRNVEIP